MAKTIKELRQRSGLSQGNFAKLFGISVKNIQNWEQGRTKAPNYLIDMMEELLETKMQNYKGKKDNRCKKQSHQEH